MTNAEYIRGLNDEDLADFIAEVEAYRRATAFIGDIINKETILEWPKEEYVND